MSRTGNATRNIIWGIFSKCIMIALPFLMRTIMVHTMGMEFLGLNGLFVSVLQVLNIAELGINSAIIFSMYKPLAENNDEEVRALMNFYKKCYRIIGIIVLALGVLVIPFLRHVISGEVPEGINIYILYAMNLSSMVLSYEVFAHWTPLLIANQRNDVVNKILAICAAIQFGMQASALLFFENYYLYILVLIIMTIINNTIAAIMAKKMYPQYYCEGNISPETFKSIRLKVAGMVFQKIGGVILSSVDIIVISAFLGLTSLAIYQNYYYIITALFGILQVIMSSLISTVGNSVATESKEKNHDDFKKFNFIYIWIVAWWSICLLCLYQPFMRIWMGEAAMLSNELVVLFSIYFFVHKWCDMLYVYQEATGIWWETKWVPLIAATINLVGNLILVNIIGLAGVVISTIVSVILIYDIGYARVVFKVYFKGKGNYKEYLLRQLFYLGGALVAALPVVWVCNILPVTSTFWTLLSRAVICVALPNVIFVILWNRLPEYKATKQLLKNILSKRIHLKR